MLARHAQIWIVYCFVFFSALHRARELWPLERVQDNYERLVITLDKALDDDYNGIYVAHIIDWLFS